MLPSSALTAQLAQLTVNFAGRVSSAGGGALCQAWVAQPDGDGSVRMTTQVRGMTPKAIKLSINPALAMYG